MACTLSIMFMVFVDAMGEGLRGALAFPTQLEKENAMSPTTRIIRSGSGLLFLSCEFVFGHTLGYCFSFRKRTGILGSGAYETDTSASITHGVEKVGCRAEHVRPGVVPASSNRTFHIFKILTIGIYEWAGPVRQPIWTICPLGNVPQHIVHTPIIWELLTNWMRSVF